MMIMDCPFLGQCRMIAILFVFNFLVWWSVSSPVNKISMLRTQKDTITTEDGVNINTYCSVRCCSPPNTLCVHAAVAAAAKSLQSCPTQPFTIIYIYIYKIMAVTVK